MILNKDSPVKFYDLTRRRFMSTISKATMGAMIIPMIDFKSLARAKSLAGIPKLAEPRRYGIMSLVADWVKLDVDDKIISSLGVEPNWWDRLVSLYFYDFMPRYVKKYLGINIAIDWGYQYVLPLNVQQRHIWGFGSSETRGNWYRALNQLFTYQLISHYDDVIFLTHNIDANDIFDTCKCAGAALFASSKDGVPVPDKYFGFIAYSDWNNLPIPGPTNFDSAFKMSMTWIHGLNGSGHELLHHIQYHLGGFDATLKQDGGSLGGNVCLDEALEPLPNGIDDYWKLPVGKAWAV